MENNKQRIAVLLQIVTNANHENQFVPETRDY